MIRKWYNVTCDYCGAAISHYTVKPTRGMLEADGAICTATKQFCSGCIHDNPGLIKKK